MKSSILGHKKIEGHSHKQNNSNISESRFFALVYENNIKAIVKSFSLELKRKKFSDIFTVSKVCLPLL